MSEESIEDIFKRIWGREPLIRAKRRELEDLLSENHEDIRKLKDCCKAKGT